MTIQEQLNAINETFVKLHKDFVRFEAEKKSLSSRFALEYSRVQEKWDKERERISAVKEDVLKYYRIAKDNSSGPRAELCREFAEILKEATHLPVAMWDERRTTVEAHNILSQHNYHGKKRKDTVDAVAASLILEGYLAYKKR